MKIVRTLDYASPIEHTTTGFSSDITSKHIAFTQISPKVLHLRPTGPPSLLHSLTCIAIQMWNDQPIKRPQESNDLPPSSRAYYSPFVHSFTPPALINDPYAVEKKLTITPLLLGPSRHKIFRRDEKFDPALERVRYYVGSEALRDEEVEASLTLQAIEDDEWCDADEDEYVDVCMERKTMETAFSYIRLFLTC